MSIQDAATADRLDTFYNPTADSWRVLLTTADGAAALRITLAGDDARRIAADILAAESEALHRP